MASDLNALHVFAKVVQTGSFTAAALSLKMPKSTVSQRVSELEERLGARLLQRTTRKLGLTDAGRIYYEYCVRIVAEVEDADRAVAKLQETPRGLLRMTVPASTQFLGPVFSEFLTRCSGVRLEVLCTDRSVDLVEESFDLAIRAGGLPDSTLVARNLGLSHFVLVASPRYLKKHGRPRSPQDLTKHDCLIFGVGAQPRVWHLTQGNEASEVKLTPKLSVNDLDILQNAAIGGVGVALLPDFRCVEDLRAKRLELVLPNWHAPSQPVHAVYPTGRHLSPKVRVMLDHLQKRVAVAWALATDGGKRPSPSDLRSKRRRDLRSADMPKRQR
jgi:DNA-binding transcriptional LysR family regulator